ncbi:MAG TPA: 50S ribosomal protein L18 [bacterium]|nr:50S ribosomal protein L18 [bacterium]
MKKDKTKLDKRVKRHRKVRTKIIGAGNRPRISVFRSNRHIFVQLIDDSKGITIVSASDLNYKPVGRKKTNKVEIAREVGKDFAKKTLAKKIKTAVFDRSGYKYHGRVKAVAESLREAGIKI